ncbi:MAG: hypothetical protein HYY18_13145 [Planctomycetes bacterium]|nr:hypothetical protein [Planctomycetota bacterium]
MPRSPEEPTFFLDRCLGSIVVAEALRKSGAQVTVHADHFRHDCPDVEWLAAVGPRRWIVLTKDKWIKRRELERKALEEAKVAAFVLAAKDLTGEQIGAAFVASLPRLRQFALSYARPLLGTVSRKGEVVLLAGERRGGLRRE